VLALARWGQTLGKAVFELEVVSIATTQRPTLVQAIRRELFLVGGPVALMWLAAGLHAASIKSPPYLFTVLTIAFVGYLVASFVHAGLRIPGKRAPWDRFSGTMVRYRTRRGSTGAVA
jgi:uncharacterized RDD family membrane protein YckC